MGGRSFTVEPLPASFGARVSGVRLASLSDTDLAQVREAWFEFGLLIFPDQGLNRDEQVALARRFGPLVFDLLEISNTWPDGSVRPADDAVVRAFETNKYWHQDNTYQPVQALGAVFSALTVPPQGGETAFADLAAAWDALAPAEQRRLEGLTALHSVRLNPQNARKGEAGPEARLTDLQGGTAARRRPLLKIHPVTGRKCLAVGRHAYALEGWPQDSARALLDQLTEQACQPPRVWAHRWTAGDAVLWDNIRLAHRALPWDMSQPRVMWQSRIAGDPATEGSEAVDAELAG